MPTRRRSFSLILALLCLLAILFCLIWPPLLLPQSANFAAISQGNEFSNHSTISSSLRPVFGHQIWNELDELNCSRLLISDDEYVQNARTHRIVQRDPSKLAMDCPSIRSRWKFASKAGTKEEAEFPIAFARTVFRASKID